MSSSTRIPGSPADEKAAGSDGVTPGLADEHPPGDTAAEAGGEVGRRRKRPILLSWAVTALACLLVMFALIAPNRINGYTPLAFVRIPVEGLICVALALALPPKGRRAVAVLFGVVFGVLAIVKIADIGFYAVLDRPFHPNWDWPLLKDGVEFLTTSIGRAGAIATVIAVALLAVAVIVSMVWSLLRLTRLMAGRRRVAARAVMVLGAAWTACAVVAAQIMPGVPVAAIAVDRSRQVGSDLQDNAAFARQMAVDRFRGAAGGDLLAGLRGKDVLLAFVESYGRSAIESPRMGPQVSAVLDAGYRELRTAGFDARSAFLTSPTSGGGSWLAHSTLLSGVWVDNQQRYDRLVKTDRLTLTTAFRRGGWRTVAVVPGTTRAWPEASFFGYDQVYDRWHLGYRGPGFNWATPPDQYTLSAFQRFERAKPHHTPVMAEMPMVSSHSPWAPTPQMIDWKNVGDGSVFQSMWERSPQPDKIWGDPAKIRDAYRGSIEYSLNALVSYVKTYGDDDLVVVFLGDHQAAPLVAGFGAGHDVPITIVAKDPAVLNRVSGWGWQNGLKPGPHAPTWPMNSFRDRFLTAFSH